MRRVTGKPKFDALQLMNAHIVRGPAADEVSAEIVFVDSSRPIGANMCGSFRLQSHLHHLSKKSLEMATNLISALEEDAAVLLYPDHEEKQEEERVEPKGIVDEEEEVPQV